MVFIILLMCAFCSLVIGLPSPNTPPVLSTTLTTASIPNPLSTSTPIPMPHSNNTIAVLIPPTTKPTPSTLILTPPDHAMNSSIPNPASKSESQHGWSPGDVGTILFGCIGLVLGILTLWLTFWLGRQRFRFIIKEGFQDGYQLQDLT